jgi:hypothetical protein
MRATAAVVYVRVLAVAPVCAGLAAAGGAAAVAAVGGVLHLLPAGEAFAVVVLASASRSLACSSFRGMQMPVAVGGDDVAISAACRRRQAV